MKIILGVPVFSFEKLIDVIVPAGQYDSALKVFNKFSAWNPLITAEALSSEYGSFYYELNKSFPEELFVLMRDELLPKYLQQAVRNSGMKILEFSTRSAEFVRFPRDLWTVISEDFIAVNPEDDIFASVFIGDSRVIASPMGEGGRVYVHNKKIICTEYFTFMDDIKVKSADFFEPFLERGYSFVVLENHLLRSVDEGKVWVEPDDHIDRVMGKLVDNTGQLHMIVNPKLFVGMQKGVGKALGGSKSSLCSWRRQLERNEILMHVPKGELVIPMSCGFYQHPSGKVFMTSGEDTLYEVVASIIPTEDIVLLHRNIEVYPSCLGAGLHCLENEAPDWFLNLITPIV